MQTQRCFVRLLALFLWGFAAAGDARGSSDDWRTALTEARNLELQERYPEAEAALHALVARLGRGAAPSEPVSAALNDLAVVQMRLGKPAQAEKSLSRAIPLMEKSFGNESALLIVPLVNLAGIHLETGRAKLAVRVAERAVAIASLPDRGLYKDGLAVPLHCLATAHQANGDLLLAEGLFQKVLALRESPQSQPDLSAGHILNNLASLNWQLRRREQAEHHARQSLAAIEAALGQDHPESIHPLLNLGLMLNKTRRSGEALVLSERALKIAEESLPPGSALEAQAWMQYAQVLRALRRKQEAVIAKKRAERISAGLRNAYRQHTVHVSELAK